MPIEPRTNDYVDGGRWLDAPGSGMLLCATVARFQLTSCIALESGAYALAMAMATEPGITGVLDWSAGTLEKRYYDAVQDIQSQYLGFDDANHVLSDGDLADIMLRWERRYKDTYDLYIDNEDDIKPAQLSSDSTQDAKVVLLRSHKGRWQACCYFGEEGGSAGTPHDDSSTDQHSSSQSSTNSMRDRTSGHAGSRALQEQGNCINGVNNTSAPVELTSERLLNNLERLVSSVETLALAVETRKASEEKLYVAIDNLTATLDKTNQYAQASTQNSLGTTAKNHDSTTSTEYGTGLDTPSTVQDTEIDDDQSELNIYDDLGPVTPPQDVIKNRLAYEESARDIREGLRNIHESLRKLKDPSSRAAEARICVLKKE